MHQKGPLLQILCLGTSEAAVTRAGGVGGSRLRFPRGTAASDHHNVEFSPAWRTSWPRDQLRMYVCLFLGGRTGLHTEAAWVLAVRRRAWLVCIFYSAQRRDCALVWQLSTSFTSTSRLCVRRVTVPSFAARRKWSSCSETCASEAPSKWFAHNRKKEHRVPSFFILRSPLSSSLRCSYLRALHFFFSSPHCRLHAVVSLCCSWLRSRLFSDQQRLHCSQPEHRGRIPTDVLYSTLWRICPF